MSTFPGSTLEDYLMFWYDLIVDDQDNANPSLRIAEILGTTKYRRLQITEEQFKSIIDLFEPWRDQIENSLDNYPEDSMSWRDYCGYPMDEVCDETVKNKARTIIEGYKNEKQNAV